MTNYTFTKNIFLSFFFLMIFFSANAQENERYTQYFYNLTSINPAFAGTNGITTFLGAYRAQWVGVPGAPKTSSLSINSSLKDKRLGFGMSIISDQIGPSDQVAVSADFSYNIELSTQSRLSFGIKASANLLNVDFTKLYLKDGADPVFEDNIRNKFSPNIGAGLYFYNKNTSIGISVPNLLATKFYDKYSSSASVSSIAKEKMNLFFTADRIFELDYYLKFKPGLLVKIGENSVQTYTSATFMVNDVFTIGMSYRFGGTICNLAGFQINDKMFIGYSYDLETKSMRNYNTGSHEIFLRFDFLSKTQKRSSLGGYF
ncbi:type IX secretion system membrane protein PorP/SprF [Flavobacterium sp. FlaQc-57]|uniref:PorP/SprF family type IX secretion system membrane protein n=1 Tax=Flavobacterium sp. FlaQc-57 TaxID=3374186 RepID=UPI003757206D